METLQISMWFSVNENLAADHLLGITYTDRCMKQNSSMDVKIGPAHCALVPVSERDEDL